MIGKPDGFRCENCDIFYEFATAQGLVYMPAIDYLFMYCSQQCCDLHKQKRIALIEEMYPREKEIGQDWSSGAARLFIGHPGRSQYLSPTRINATDIEYIEVTPLIRQRLGIK